MKRQSTYKMRNSIGFRLIVGVIGVLAPFLVLLIYNNFYAINVVRNQVAESNRNMVSLYLKQIDNSLQDVENYFANLIANDVNLYKLNNYNNRDEYMMAKILLINRLTNDVLIYKEIDNFFVYSAALDEFSDTNPKPESYEDREKMKEYIRSILYNTPNPDDLSLKEWHAIRVENQYYLLRTMKEDNIYVGAWVKAINLLMPMNLINLGSDGTSLFTADNGIPMSNQEFIAENQIILNRDLKNYYLSGIKKKFLVIGKESSVGNFSLIALIPDKEILEQLPRLRSIIELVSIVSIVLLPLCLLFVLRITILVPLHRLLSAMREIRKNNMDTRIEPYPTTNEFQTVNDTFNDMIDQIHNLKISVYEEQLNKQKAELKHLQLQINPHFFINSLNIIYSFALTQNYNLIKDMTQCLVKYFRYMFRSNMAFIPLKDELEHVRNYLHIQELRSPNSFTYKIEAHEKLVDTPIPPLMIQTFAENTIKHAVNMSSPIHLSIRIEYLNEELKHYMKVTVQDTGMGFDREVLEKLASGCRIATEKRECIGIWNVQKRLNILYSGNASISFSNAADGGAIVEITLPAGTQEKEGCEESA